ncbi:glycosyltransferase family 90 protein [Pseudohyphozyma bogoriensis]|nr:glycosyltransferase family 90 protein [Pseudohyphozyma bogoriensis]
MKTTTTLALLSTLAFLGLPALAREERHFGRAYNRHQRRDHPDDGGSSEKSDSVYGSDGSGYGGEADVDVGAAVGGEFYSSSAAHFVFFLWSPGKASTPAYTTAAYAAPAQATQYGSGSTPSSYQSCVQTCQAQFGMGGASAPPPAPNMTAGVASTPPPAALNATANATTPLGDLRMVPFAISAETGSTVTFVWGAGPLTQSSALEICNKTLEAGAFASGMQNASFEYPVEIKDASKPIWYFCGVPTHCQKGMFGVINPAKASDTSSSLESYMQNAMSSNSELSQMYQETKTYCSDSADAWAWGAKFDATQFAEDVLESAMMNTLATRQYFARNPSLLAAAASGNSDAAASGLSEEDQKCRKFPWMARCVGKEVGAPDPFANLHFTRKGGHLLYPAHSADGDEAVIPPDQPHPIHLLMDEAAKSWERKLKRQSKTLREAVAEYERRYGMRPPKGFDEWFEFAKSKGFVLVDEFDSLHEKILPYLSLPSAFLQERAQKLQHDPEFWLQDKTFTLLIREGKSIEKAGPMADNPNGRADQMRALLKGVAPHLPDMNITFTGHDVPWVGLSGEARRDMKAAARAGEYLDERLRDDYRDNWDYDGWASICPPGSPIREMKHFDDRSEEWVQSPPSFIEDHQAAMDLCQHPERQTIHGFTAWPGPRPGLLYPIFSFTGTTIHADFLAPPIDQWDYRTGEDPEWEGKKVNAALWRGSTTGADLNNPHMRKWSQRPRLCRLPHLKGAVTVPWAAHDTPGKLGPTETITTSATNLASQFFDIKFFGKPEQCNDEIACAKFQKEFQWDTWLDAEDQNLYKYILDVDGNGWSGRFHRLMSLNSVILKSTIFPEWYQDHIQPWLHYIPVATDYADLWAIMAFFRGGKKGYGNHDDLAKKIGTEGKKWTANHWRWEDMEVYFYRLLIEYNRIMARDEDFTSQDF